MNLLTPRKLAVAAVLALGAFFLVGLAPSSAAPSPFVCQATGQVPGGGKSVLATIVCDEGQRTSTRVTDIAKLDPDCSVDLDTGSLRVEAPYVMEFSEPCLGQVRLDLTRVPATYTPKADPSSACFGVGNNWSDAVATYERNCTDERVDCDPIEGGKWRCANLRMDNGMVPSPAAPTPDPGAGDPFDGADAAFTLSGRIAPGSIDGTVMDSKVLLPVDAKVVVTLEDVSLLGAPSVTIAERSYTGGALPLDYSLTWNSALEERRTYNVAASVRSANGDLLYVTDTAFEVAPGQTEMDFHVVPVGS